MQVKSGVCLNLGVHFRNLFESRQIRPSLLRSTALQVDDEQEFRRNGTFGSTNFCSFMQDVMQDDEHINEQRRPDCVILLYIVLYLLEIGPGTTGPACY